MSAERRYESAMRTLSGVDLIMLAKLGPRTIVTRERFDHV